MKLKLVRFEFSDKYTVGKLYVNDTYQCFVLEDTVRADGVKVAHKTAIPKGTYKVIIDYSNRFKRELPHILNVPMFEGIRIHPGNTSENTEGCLLVGETYAGTDFIGNSRVAFNKLFDKMKASKEPITIEIV